MVTLQIGLEKSLGLQKWTYKINVVNGEETVGTPYEKKLQKDKSNSLG